MSSLQSVTDPLQPSTGKKTKREINCKKGRFFPGKDRENSTAVDHVDHAVDAECLAVVERSQENVIEIVKNGRQLIIINPSQEVKRALSQVGDDDPPVALSWYIDNLCNAVSRANIARTSLPPWLAGIAYPISMDQLIRGIIQELANSGSGNSFHNYLLAANTMEQYSRIQRENVLFHDCGSLFAGDMWE